MIFLVDQLVKIRRSDRYSIEKLYPIDVTPQFLQQVFDLEAPPAYLKSEISGIKMKINQSNLALNETYIIRGPGPELAMKRAETTSQNDGKLYQF